MRLDWLNLVPHFSSSVSVIILFPLHGTSILLTSEYKSQGLPCLRSHSWVFPLFPRDYPSCLSLSIYNLLISHPFVSYIRLSFKYTLTPLLNCQCFLVWSTADYLLCFTQRRNQSTSFNIMGHSLRILFAAFLAFFFFQAQQLIFPSSFYISCCLHLLGLPWRMPADSYCACKWFLENILCKAMLGLHWEGSGEAWPKVLRL